MGIPFIGDMVTLRILYEIFRVLFLLSLCRQFEGTMKSDHITGLDPPALTVGGGEVQLSFTTF